MTSESSDQVLLLYNALDGGIVNSKEMAVNLASIYILRAYGQEYLNFQQPLDAKLENEMWHISSNKIFSHGNEKTGPIRCDIRAYDGALIKFGASFIFETR
jgi:hypothetical protein